MTVILLVGANGQLGWEVARRVNAVGLSCHALGREQLDITHSDAVLRTVESLAPSVTVNAAAYTAVDRAESDVEAAFAVNRDGAAHLAQACAAAKVPLIHVSTDYVFDGSKLTPYDEEDPVEPLSIYGKSKFAGEEAIRRYWSNHLILRTSWLFGIHGNNFVKTMLRLGRECETLRVVDDQLGNPTFVGDLAKAILMVITRLQSSTWPARGFGTFHCTGQGATTRYAFAHAIFDIAAPRLGRMPNIEAIKTTDYPTPAQRPRYSVLNCSKLEETHGIVLPPWRASLNEMLDAALGSPVDAQPGQ
jgi:dTDP-4-dehydrorhamnose reductase